MADLGKSRSLAARFVLEAARDAAMQPVLALARRATRTTASVLITGETGTGKRALADWIHANGAQRGGPLVRLGGAALVDDLLAVAVRDRSADGVFAAAAGGTVVIEEPCDLPPEAQAALAQLLDAPAQRGPHATGPRVIATSRQAAERAVRTGELRADLYYSLSVIAIAVPPIRQRAGDIPALVAAFLARSTPRPVVISAPALAWLAGAAWPGNVRELESTIERAVALSDDGVIEVEDLAGLAPGYADGELTQVRRRRRSFDR